MSARNFTGRADLLRCLVARCGEQAAAVDPAVERRLAELLDLHPQPAAPPPATYTGRESQVERATPTGPEASAPQAPPARRAPLQARWFAILHREPLAEAESTPISAVPRQALSAEDCAPRKQGTAPVTPLVVRTRLWPALRRALARPRLGRLDVPALVRTLSKVQTLHRLPRHKLRNWGSELVVVVDIAQRLIPYDADYAQLLTEVRRLHGRDGIVVWTVVESPESTLAVQRGRGAHRVAPGPVVPPPAGTPVLILGDLGLLSGAPQLQQGWGEFCCRLAEAGVQPVVWLPCSGRLVTAEAARHAQLHSLGERDLRPLKRAAAAAPYRPQAALEALLTRIACCVRVEPPLLRSLRRMAPDTAAEPGLEALLWAHAPVVSAGARFCELAPAYQAEYRARFAALGAAAQAEILRRVLDAHAYRGRATESAEALIWHAHARAEALAPELSAHVEAARDWFARLSEFHAVAPGDVVAYARDLFARHGGDAAFFGGNSRALATLWALTGNATIPAGLNSADIASARHAGTKAGAYELVQQGKRLVLRPWREQRSAGDRPDHAKLPAQAAGSHDPSPTALAWPRVEIAGDGFEWSRADGSARHWLMPPPPGGELQLPLGDDATATTYQLVAAGSCHHVGLLSRPCWAPEWGRDREALYALAPAAAAEPATLYWSDAPDSAPPGPRAFRALAKTLPGGVRLGADLDFGLWLDVEVGGITQRLRWIEPGEFLMGSPADEPERYEGEGPRHQVRLTQGFWLSDTACTQALWQAVMGDNPSRFRDDPKNPVENVRWDDVQSFLRKLEGVLPGYEAGLPSEAQWEYACRAGTGTAFSFGNTITPAQANYDGRKNYAGGPTGEYRGKTVPVKHFEANAWGLYQMHGNVWEWCADGQRDYDASAQVDPRGPEGDRAERVVRGGAWYFAPWWLRCAFRSQWPRDIRHDYLGFRFSLRSIGPGGAERRPEAAAAPEGPQAKAAAPGRRRTSATPPTKPKRKR